MNPASIEIRPLATPRELQQCVSLQRETWGDDFSDVVPASILNVAQRIGGVAVGAFDEHGTLLGFVFGLTGVERGRVVHWSDMLAVRPEARNLGLGRRLKEHQRHAVRELGATLIYWTFDPLVARNAHLNFNRLGVRLADYVEDMYGITDSELHGGIPTDRLIVAWPTDDREIESRLSESERALASADCRQGPVVTADWMERVRGASILPHSIRIRIPADGERVLVGERTSAERWRGEVRSCFNWALAGGYSVSAFLLEPNAECGYYLLTKNQRPALVASGRG
ncbi:MAG TPA: GNAT family N-acetyltransferase [Gemmatimonadaceae bacterium]|nr:GNAT family N-acetyltransferase [Gemmatimonadaceae bacterium]